MNIKDYLESGTLEAFVLGSASAAEADELQHLKVKHPEIGHALDAIEADLEMIAQHMAIMPPPGMLERIEDRIHELKKQPVAERLPDQRRDYGQSSVKDKGQYIEVEGASSHMRIHKIWRWIFAAVFILGKIFLGFAIYFYLENRQAREEVKELKREIRQHHTIIGQ